MMQRKVKTVEKYIMIWLGLLTITPLSVFVICIVGLGILVEIE
jgi:hypothetical protein